MLKVISRNISFILASFVMLWLGGLFTFVYTSFHLPKEKETGIKSVIILTGAPYRLQEGLNLWQKETDMNVLISGVHNTTHLNQILRQAGLAYDDKMGKKVTLGFQAKTTSENANEAKLWLHEHQLDSTYLVTSHYHMLRSLWEFRKHMPYVKIVPYTVYPYHNYAWWNWPYSLRLLFIEYHKFLFVVVQDVLSGKIAL